MLYVQRDAKGKVVGVCPYPQEWAQEPLEDNHPDIVAYNTAGAKRDARITRDTLLYATDWLVTRHRDQSDAGTPQSLSVANYAALLAYRQALRDWPDGQGFPATIPPSKPSFLN